jgi:thioester reductase-like protein
MNNTVFLTGATGLIGSYLLKVLLQNNYKVYVLTRSKDGKVAEDRVREALGFWDEKVLSNRDDNLIVLEGDITIKNLGLRNYDIELLKNEMEEIYHSAASTQFNLPLEQIREYNVKGTKNVLDLAFKCKEEGRLKKVNHLSTAYVCGDFKGVFKEDDLDAGQRFNSTYEQSKFEAEKLIEEYRRKGLWIDIFRPPLVIGESLTGKTTTFQQGVYQLLHMWNLEIFDCFPGKGFYINMVFVDELCNALFKVSSMTSTPNKNFHLFNKAVPLENLLDISSEFFGFRKPVLVSRDEFFGNNPTPAQRILLQNNILLHNNEVLLDSTMTNTFLKKHGFAFPDFNRDSFLKILKYCIREGFLKKR